MGHFVSSPREREKRDRRDSRGGDSRGDEERGRAERGTGMKEKKQKHSTSTLTCFKDSRPCPTISQSQLDASVT